MACISVLSRSELALMLPSCALIGYIVVSGVAAMVAIWHPDPRRRSSALKVLELFLATLRPGERQRQPGASE
jgi:hypothetical protein